MITDVSCHCIASVDELQAIGQDIDDFLLTQTRPTFFVSSAWLILWCKHFLKPDDRLWCQAFYVDHKLVGLAPFYFTRDHRFQGWTLRFIGEGEPEDEEVSSEYQDIFINDAAVSSSLTLLTDALLSQRKINTLAFKNILQGALLTTWLSDYCSQYWSIQITPSGKRFALAVARDASQQTKTFPGSRIRKHYTKWADIAADVTIDCCKTADELDLYWQRLKTLHLESWAGRGKQTAFIHPRFNDFHSELIQILHNADQLCLFSVKRHDVLIAAFYGWYADNTLYYYQSGIRHVNQKPTAGAMMHFVAIELARYQGIACYDLMKGGNNSYKVDYVDGGLSMQGIVAYRGLALLKNQVKALIRKCKSYVLRYR